MTEAQPAASVVMASYNAARHLALAIRSVLEQTLGSLELIVVDDASTDASMAVVQSAAERDHRVRLIAQPANRGPGGARNRALEAARGRWIAVCDADDLMAPERLERLIGRAEADGADIVADNLLAFLDGRPEAGRLFLRGAAVSTPRWIGLADLIDSSRMYAARPGFGYLKPVVSAEALRRSRVRYDEALRIGEDYDFLLRLLAAGLALRFEPEALYGYRRGAPSTSQVLRREHIEAMLEADARFLAEFPDMPPSVLRAQARRRASLETALVYDEVISSLKRRDFRAATARVLPNPAVWPLFAMPIAARARRLRRPSRSPSAALEHPAA